MACNTQRIIVPSTVGTLCVVTRVGYLIARQHPGSAQVDLPHSSTAAQHLNDERPFLKKCYDRLLESCSAQWLTSEDNGVRRKYYNLSYSLIASFTRLQTWQSPATAREGQLSYREHYFVLSC